MDERPVSAVDIVRNPDIVAGFINQYILLRDSSVNGTYRNLIEAINLIAERGWETLSIGGDYSGNLFALCGNTHYKRKIEPPES